jgi:DNA mismatch repair protein MutS
MMATRAREKADDLYQVAQGLGEIDVLCALADLAETDNLCRPHLDHSLDFDVKDGRHPVVETLLKGRNGAFIPNDCHLSDAKDSPADCCQL